MGDLGPVLSTHKGRIAAGGVIWYCCGFIVVGSVWGLLTGLVALDFGRAGGALGGIALGGLGLLWAYSKYAQTLSIHQHGFVWNRFLRAPLTVRWSDVKNVRIERIHERKTLHMKGVHVEIEIELMSGGYVVLTNDIDKVEDIQGYLSRPQPVAAPGGAPAVASPWG